MAAPTPGTHSAGMKKVLAWEAAWSNYIAKLERLDELKAQGRYGYQLRMPKLSAQNAFAALRAFSGPDAKAIGQEGGTP